MKRIDNVEEALKSFEENSIKQAMKRFILFFAASALLLCGCSSDDNDDYLRCSDCHKILTTDYYICPDCKANICPSCIIINKAYGLGHSRKTCPICRHIWI